jgi:hypothetical protein
VTVCRCCGLQLYSFGKAAYPITAKAGCARVALNVKKVLQALPASLAPQVVGVSIAEAEVRLARPSMNLCNNSTLTYREKAMKPCNKSNVPAR